MNSIGDRITQMRQRMGITQKKLAKMACITEASLSRYENGLREPKINTLIKISEVLGCTMDYLVGKNDIDNGVIISKSSMPERMQDLGSHYIDLAMELSESNIEPSDVQAFISIIRRTR